jgi:hypothetical protein
MNYPPSSKPASVSAKHLSTAKNCRNRTACLIRPRRLAGFVAISLWAMTVAGCQRPGPARQAKASASSAGHEEIKLEAALSALKDQSDVSACRSALKQLNAGLNRVPDRKPQPLTPAREKFLRERVGLDPGEVQEVGAVNFTLLDGAYWRAACSCVMRPRHWMSRTFRHWSGPRSRSTGCAARSGEKRSSRLCRARSVRD